jgi:hypothetical protein
MIIGIGQRGICPHCNTANRFEGSRNRYRDLIDSINVTNGIEDKNKVLRMCRCTNCGENIIFFGERMIYPLGSSRQPCPKEVPTSISEDYNESCLVEPLSPKAAAALARRCLQNMLHERGINTGNLSTEIDKAMEILPSHLSESIDAIRNIGNFAAHPIKFQSTGQIAEVEEGEAEWILDVIEQLFDFYYVQPAITKEKKDLLDAKLSASGKPKMK